MAKLSRSQLKGIVKECLMEILTEGLASSDSSLTENIRPSKKRASRRPAVHRAPVDTVSFNTSVDQTVSRVTDDPLMASILADTAKTTFQEQIGADSASSGLVAPDAGVNIEDTGGLFEGAAENWAYLAFDAGKKY